MLKRGDDMGLLQPGAKYLFSAATQAAQTAIANDTTKASLEDVNTQLGLKADSSALDLKADNSALTVGLAGKVSTSTYTAGMALKADTSYVNNQLDLKANLTTVTTELGLKADTTYVNTQLGLKANTTALTAGLAAKADIATMNSELALKANLVQVLAIGSDNWLKLFAQDPEPMFYGTIQRNRANVVTSAPVLWPDGVSGVYTPVIDDKHNVPNSYMITYGSSVTVTQPTVTRNNDGYITSRPQLTITRT